MSDNEVAMLTMAGIGGLAALMMWADAIVKGRVGQVFASGLMLGMFLGLAVYFLRGGGC